MSDPKSEQDAAIDSASNPANISSIKKRGAVVPRRQFADIIESTLRGAQGGIAASSQAAQFGDPLTSFLAGAAGAASGPSPDEIAAEDARARAELAQSELLNTPISSVSPQIANMLSGLGIDPNTATWGEVNKYSSLLSAAGEMQKAQESLRANQPLDAEGSKFWARVTNLPESELIGKTPADIRLAVDAAAKVSKGPVARMEEIEAKSKMARASKDMTVDERQFIVKANPGLFTDESFKEAFLSGTGRISTQVGLGVSQQASQERRAEAAVKRQENLLVLRDKMKNEAAQMSPGMRAMYENLFKVELPEGIKSTEAKQALTMTKLSASNSKMLRNSQNGLEAIGRLKELVSNAGHSTMFTATSLRDSSLGDLARSINDKLTGESSEEINAKASEVADIITRLRTGAALNKNEETFYSRLILRWARSPVENMRVLNFYEKFFDRVKQDIEMGRRATGKKFDSIFIDPETGSFTDKIPSGFEESEKGNPVKDIESMSDEEFDIELQKALNGG